MAASNDNLIPRLFHRSECAPPARGLTLGLLLFFVVYRLMDANQFQGWPLDMGPSTWQGRLLDIVVSHPCLLFGALLLVPLLRNHRLSVSLSPICILVGFLLFVLDRVMGTTGTHILPVATSILLGIGVIGSFAGWMQVLSRKGMVDALKALAVASVASAFVRLVVYLCASAALYYVVLCCAFVFGSLSLWMLSADFHAARDREAREANASSASLESLGMARSLRLIADNYLHPLLCIVIVSFALACIRPLSASAESPGDLALVLHFIGILVGSIALLLAWNRMEVLFASNRLSCGLSIVVVLGFVLLPYGGSGFESLLVSLLSALYAAVVIVLLAIVVEASKENPSWAVPLTAILFGAMYLSSTLGSLLNLGLAANPQGVALVTISVAAVLALTVLLLDPGVKDASVDTSVIPEDAARSERAGGTVLVNLSEEAIRGSAILRVRYRLSERELDVLVLLLSSRTAPGIARSLAISENTVKTHMRNTYQKLGVHSKEGLIDLVVSVLKEEDLC